MKPVYSLVIICLGLQTCQIQLEQKVAALEEQLVDLDQQHQAALEVAVTSRDQLKEENRQLQLQLLQLANEKQQDQQVSPTFLVLPYLKLMQNSVVIIVNERK